jgi:3-hydroxymyristoyl/3-hydroxydecanoyl-(acyl carrier protein) dehydratase
MPGVLIIEAAAQAVAIMCRTESDAEARAYLANVNMSFRLLVTPGDQMVIEAGVHRRMGNLLIAKVKVRVAGAVVAEGEITVAQKPEGA